jgi:hypothetical protein
VPRRKPIGGCHDDAVVAIRELGRNKPTSVGQSVIVKYAAKGVDEKQVPGITDLSPQSPDRVLTHVALQQGRTENERILQGEPR